MILELQQALKDDGVFVSLVKLCGWFGVPDHGLAGSQTACWIPPEDSGASFGCGRSE